MLAVGCAATALWGCRMDTAAGDDLPPTSPVQGQEPIQTVPAEPPGPAEPMPETEIDQPG